MAPSRLELTDEQTPRPPSTSAAAGRWLVLAAVLLWSLSGIFAKASSFDRWPPVERGIMLGFYRAAFAGLLLLPFCRRITWTWRLLPAMLCFTVMNTAYLSAVVLTTAATGIWLQYTSPLWIFAITWIYGRRKPRSHEVFTVVLIAVGIAMMLAANLNAPDTDATSNWKLGTWLGLLSGVAFGGVLLSYRWLNDLDAVWLTSINHLGAAALMLPLLAALGIWQTPAGSQWPLLAAFGMVQMGIPYVLLARASRAVSSREVALITLLEPVLMPLWVWLLQGETAQPEVFLAACCIFLALAINAGVPWWRERKRRLAT